MTTYDDIFAFSGFDYVNHIGHTYYSGVFVKNRIILYLKVFALSECIIDRVSFEHERHFNPHLETNNVIILELLNRYVILSAQSVKHFLVGGLYGQNIIAFLGLTKLMQIDTLFNYQSRTCEYFELALLSDLITDD